MKRLFLLVLLVVFFAVSLGGCSCWPKEVKSQPAPAPVVQKAPEPVRPTPPPPPPEPKKGRN